MTVVSVTATLLAFGAVYGDGLTSTGFETEGSNPAYVAGQDLSTAKDDAGAVAGDNDFAATWVSTNLEEGVAIVTAYDGEGAAAKADVAAATGVATTDLGSNYLKLDGAPLISRYAQAGGTAVNIGDGLYIDTLVQFTAADPETPPTPDVDGGDKLCIWLADNEEDQTQCTLMVTAGFVDDEYGNVVVTNYATSKIIANNSWHRLQVKILSAIDSEDTAWLSDGFVVFIDGTAITTTTCPIDTDYVNSYTLNQSAAGYFREGAYAIFPSMIPQGAIGDGTITSLSFNGSGSIDNLQFTETDPITPPPGDVTYELTITATDDATNTVWTATTNGISVASGDFIEDGQAVVVVVTPNTGWEYATTPVDWSAGAAAGTITKTFTVSGAALGITIPAPTVKSSGYDSGDGEHTFEIATAKKADLEAALSTLSKTLTDTVPGSSTLTYAQAYALGLWDENDTDVAPLDATISVGADGKVTVTLANQPAEGYVVTCYIYEKATLTAEWPSTPATNYAYGSETAFTPGSATAGFYKVAIVITNQQ